MLAHAYAHLAGGDIFLDPGTCNTQAKDPYGAGGEHRSPSADARFQPSRKMTSEA